MRAFLFMVLLITGCGYVRPHFGDGTVAPVRGPLVPGTAVDTAEGLTWPTNAAPARAGGTRTQKICRSQGVPRGWVIRAYETMEGKCAGPPGPSSYNVAVIETLAGYTRGAVITICADQAIPDGWTVESDDRQEGECPGARVKQGSRTALVIYMW